ncbi:hypothetical protein B0O99DRAFT_644695 [Bisporella sp. PMI_857]|nr:hypothetical protein B0O99DRAFT_644695 [Bisporella sp. PMI_857]
METSKDADSRYARPATDTFKQYARLIMEKEGNLHYMCHAGENDRGNDLPSWVPDLRSSKYAASLLLKNGVRRSQIARCSSARGNRRFEFSEDSNELTVTGVFVDKIAKLSKDSLEDSSGGTLDRSYIQECIETDESRAGEWPAGSRIENVIRTMLADSVELEQSLDNDNDLAEAIINISRDIGDPMLLLQFLGDIKGPGSDASPLDGLIARQDPRLNAKILSDLGGVENPYVLQIKETVKSTLTMVHKHRRFAAMDSGFAGLVPSASKEGDAVYLFADCHLPVIIRQERVGEKYKFIGAALLIIYCSNTIY